MKGGRCGCCAPGPGAIVGGTAPGGDIPGRYGWYCGDACVCWIGTAAPGGGTCFGYAGEGWGMTCADCASGDGALAAADGACHAPGPGGGGGSGAPPSSN